MSGSWVGSLSTIVQRFFRIGGVSRKTSRSRPGTANPPLVRQYWALVAMKLGVQLFQLLPSAPLPTELAEVLGIALVAAPPGLRHLLPGQAGVGVPAEGDPERDLGAGLTADRTEYCEARSSIGATRSIKRPSGQR